MATPHSSEPTHRLAKTETTAWILIVILLASVAATFVILLRKLGG